MTNEIDWDAALDESVELFKGLLALDTTNPPGNEQIAAEYLADALADDGLDPWTVDGGADGRTNLVVRLPATVDDPAPPLLLAGHTDVVPADADQWTHPPFGGVEADAMIWGRGAVDMKNMVAMSVTVARLLARTGAQRHRDLIVAAVADEEAGCAHGSAFLVDEHPDRVRAEYMLGEVGGFWQHIGGKTYIPIMVAEKGSAHVRLTARGPTGHGSIPRDDNALVHLARAIERLGTRRLPYHLTPVMERFFEQLAATQSLGSRIGLKGLLSERLSDVVLDRLLPDPAIARNFDALLHNTVSPTMIAAGTKRNVIPGEASCELDGRLLPGFSGEDLRREVAALIDDAAVEVEILSETTAAACEPIESPLLDTIYGVVGEHAPEAICVPYMIPGFTDAQYFSRLGTRCYGFSPLKIPADSDMTFSELFHGVDERVYTDGYRWGQRVLYDVVARFLSARGT